MAGILTGTPIQTTGIHPLAALMGEGADIFGRSYALASNRGAQNNSIAVGFLRDAVQERINSERLALEKRGQDMSFAQRQAEMDQRERLTMAELESRERVAGMRSSLAGRRSGGGGAAYGGGASGDQVSAILGSIFAGGGGQPQAQAAQVDPMDLAMQAGGDFAQAASGATDAASSPSMPDIPPELSALAATPQGQISLSNEQSHASKAVDENLGTSFSSPDKYAAADAAWQREIQLKMAGAYLGGTPGQKVTSAVGAATSMRMWEQEKLERSKEAQTEFEKKQKQGLGPIYGAVRQSLSPLDGFTGYKYSSAKQVDEAMKEPTTAKALNLLKVGSTELRKELSTDKFSIDDTTVLLDQYNRAANALDTQEKEASFLVSENTQPGSRTYGVQLAKELIDGDPTVATIRGHKEALEDAFQAKLKSADLSKVSPATLSRAMFSAQGSLGAARTKKESSTEWLNSIREQVSSLIPSVDAEGKPQDPSNWGWYQLEEAIKKENEGGELTDRGHTLTNLKTQWQKAKTAAAKAEAEESRWSMEVGRINNYHTHLGDTILPAVPPEREEEGRETPAAPPVDLFDQYKQQRLKTAEGLLTPR